MAYTDDILALSPDHLWTFNNVLTDSVGTATGVASGATLVSKTDLCEGNTFCLRTDAIAERVALPATTTISNSAQTRKAVGGWFQADRYQSPPKVVYAEGDTTNSFKIVLGWGNRLVFELDDNGTVFQIFGDTILEPDRSYHLMLIFEGTAYGNILRAYVDGVEQLNAEPTNRIPGLTTLTAKTTAWFGDPAGTVSIGGVEIVLLAPINGSYANWAAWDGADAILTETEIREELFEKGALASTTITNQAGLDALADSVRPNVPCCIRVTGDGTINLSADNVTFDSLASIHVQYTGTGTLNWTNTNGSNASLGSTTNGGTLNFINPATLTIDTNPDILSGAEVRIYDNENTTDSNYNTELDGVESNIGSTFQYAHSGTSNDIIIQIMKDGYEEIEIPYSIGSVDQSLTLFPKVEENA